MRDLTPKSPELLAAPPPPPKRSIGFVTPEDKPKGSKAARGKKVDRRVGTLKNTSHLDPWP